MSPWIAAAAFSIWKRIAADGSPGRSRWPTVWSPISMPALARVVIWLAKTSGGTTSEGDELPASDGGTIRWYMRIGTVRVGASDAAVGDGEATGKGETRGVGAADGTAGGAADTRPTDGVTDAIPTARFGARSGSALEEQSVETACQPDAPEHEADGEERSRHIWCRR